MAIFIIWVKICFTIYFCNARVAGLGEIFVQQKTVYCYKYAYYTTFLCIWHSLRLALICYYGLHEVFSKTHK